MADCGSGEKRSLESNSALENEERKAKVRKDAGIKEMSNFKLAKVLSEDTKSKSIVLHLQDKTRTTDEDKAVKDAVCMLERTPFSENMINLILSSDVKMNLQFNNDIYSQYLCNFPEEINCVKNTLIYPANEKHLKKYSAQKTYMVNETPEIYQKVTVPYLEEEQAHLQWVYNILEKKAETDRILFEDPHPEDGFILLPDIKWDQKQMKNLYVMGLTHKHGIRTLRDINEKHLPLLKNMLHKGTETIKNIYKVLPSQLRVFVHYQPSYYHFHVHFTPIEYDAPGSVVGKAHLLQDIIDNVENIDSNYYAKKTLCFVLREQNKLFSLFKDAGLVETDMVDV